MDRKKFARRAVAYVTFINWISAFERENASPKFVRRMESYRIDASRLASKMQRQLESDLLDCKAAQEELVSLLGYRFEPITRLPWERPGRPYSDRRRLVQKGAGDSLRYMY